MMKHLNKFNDSYYLILKNELEETFGKKISTAGDCVALSEEIYSKTCVKVNSNTLRRFFGLVKSDFSPSSTTLEILSAYCGFSSYEELIKLKNNTFKIDDQNNYRDSILSYLISLFRNTIVDKNDNKTFVSIVKYTILFLQRHLELTEKFQRAVSKTRNGQDFYFEQFVNIDALNSYYGEGLRYYLLENRTSEAQIFGNSLLCLKNWFIENKQGVKTHYEEVMKQHFEKAIHPRSCARFFAAQFLYAHTFHLAIEKILIRARHMHAQMKNEKDEYKSFPYFEFVIALVLLLIGRPAEALYYVNYSSKLCPNQYSDMEQGFYQTMELVKALTLVKTSRKKDAEKLYREIQPSKFYFLTKKINTIMYLSLSQYLNKNDIKSDKQLEDLLAQTGFTKLNEVLKAEKKVIVIE